MAGDSGYFEYRNDNVKKIYENGPFFASFIVNFRLFKLT